MHKTGVPIQVSQNYPGFSVMYNPGRIQPFTVWAGIEVIYFTHDLADAERTIRTETNDIRMGRSEAVNKG